VVVDGRGGIALGAPTHELFAVSGLVAADPRAAVEEEDQPVPSRIVRRDHQIVPLPLVFPVGGVEDFDGIHVTASLSFGMRIVPPPGQRNMRA
jgi:hypothetical protein